MVHWNVSPEIITIGSFALRWYSIMFLVSFVCGARLFNWMSRREQKANEQLEELLYYIIVGTIVGARLGHCLFYEPTYFLANPIEILKVWHGGLASHGGAVGVIVSIFVFTRKYPQFSFFWILDRVSIPIAFAAGLIRIGNLFNSEIIGKPTVMPWAFIFDRVDQIPRHPSQLYEAFTYFLTGAILLFIYKRTSPPKPGRLLGVLMIALFTSRLIWEFFKENQETFEAGMILNMGQLLSLPFIAIGIVLVVISFVKSSRTNQNRK